jgi:hypothetical protein
MTGVLQKNRCHQGCQLCYLPKVGSVEATGAGRAERGREATLRQHRGNRLERNGSEQKDDQSTNFNKQRDLFVRIATYTVLEYSTEQMLEV